MEFELKLGMKGTVEEVVIEETTAKSFGSGGVLVYATPRMISIMENAALKAVDSNVPEGYATVGIHLDVKHLAATPIGMNVRAEAELIEIKGKKLKFKVEAFDEKDKIGEGIHSRYIINVDDFVKGTEEKAKK